MSVFKNIRGLTAGVALLAASSVAQADFIDTWINGFYEDSGARRGLGLNYIPTGPEAGVLFVAYYTYDEATGAPLFVQGANTVTAGQFSVEIPINFVDGGSFGSEPGNPDTPETEEPFGTATLTFNSCNSITWEMEPVNNDFTGFSNELSSFFEFGFGAGNVPNSECVYQRAFEGCPDFAVESPTAERTCVIPGGEYTQDLTLTNDTIWALGGAVYIGQRGTVDNVNPGNSNTLYIEPGTRIIGAAGDTILGIQPGAKIMAEGTPEAPIVFSGPLPATNPSNPDQVGRPGDWGGLTINGLAPINVGVAEGEGESGAYGGDDPFDSSGVLRYVRVQFAGFRFLDTNELNGIAFQGVGAGTVVENVQVHANEDDGVEFFGGTVNARNVVLTDIRDDSLDWTEGWQGRIQNLLVIQDRDFAGSELADRGIEADNLEGDNDAEPRAKPWISHATFIGRPDTTGATLRRGTGVNITNAIFSGFQNCIDLDDASTFTNAGTPPDNLTGNLTIQNSIVDCETNFVEEDDDPWTVQSWFEAQAGNSAEDPGLVGVFPPEGASYLRGFPVGYAGQEEGYFDSFFQNYEHIGAFSGPGAAWTQGWTLQEMDFYAQ
jgi:hypothetical protein